VIRGQGDFVLLFDHFFSKPSLAPLSVSFISFLFCSMASPPVKDFSRMCSLFGIGAFTRPFRFSIFVRFHHAGTSLAYFLDVPRAFAAFDPVLLLPRF